MRFAALSSHTSEPSPTWHCAQYLVHCNSVKKKKKRNELDDERFSSEQKTLSYVQQEIKRKLLSGEEYGGKGEVVVRRIGGCLMRRNAREE